MGRRPRLGVRPPRVELGNGVVAEEVYKSLVHIPKDSL